MMPSTSSFARAAPAFLLPGDDDSSPAGTPGPSGEHAADDATVTTILVVDDDPASVLITQLSLERIGGFRVITASSGADALALAATVRIDAILLDVMMPELTGPQTLDLLRQDATTARIPVAFVTTRGRHDDDTAAALSSSGVLVIAKPIRPVDLVQTVRALIDHVPTPDPTEPGRPGLWGRWFRRGTP